MNDAWKLLKDFSSNDKLFFLAFLEMKIDVGNRTIENWVIENQTVHNAQSQNYFHIQSWEDDDAFNVDVNDDFSSKDDELWRPCILQLLLQIFNLGL